MEKDELLMVVFVSFVIGAVVGVLMGMESPEYKSMCAKSYAIAITKDKGE